MRLITIKYQGTCKRCNKNLEIGQEAYYEKSQGCFCIGCEPKDIEEIRHFRTLKAQAKADRLQARANRLETEANNKMQAFNHFRGDIAFITQPGHIPFREKILKRYDKGLELHNEAENLRERADNILNVRVKGDAERMWQEKRDNLTKSIKIGSRVYCALYSSFGTVAKINAKSLQVKLDDGYIAKLDKIMFELKNEV